MAVQVWTTAVQMLSLSGRERDGCGFPNDHQPWVSMLNGMIQSTGEPTWIALRTDRRACLSMKTSCFGAHCHNGGFGIPNVSVARPSSLMLRVAEKRMAFAGRFGKQPIDNSCPQLSAALCNAQAFQPKERSGERAWLDCLTYQNRGRTGTIVTLIVNATRLRALACGLPKRPGRDSE
jgi:hypothetical protein